MMTITDFPSTIPLFPLPSALLLPRARLPLNIFEPRYLAMIEDALKTDHRLIGMIQPRETPKGKTETSLQQIGCAGRITSFSETEDGRYLITLSGISRFRLVAAHHGFKPYLTADVDWSSFAADRGGADVDTRFDRPKFLKTLSRFFDATSLSTDWDSLKEADEELLVNSLSMLCPFEPAEKQALLEAPDLANRRETLVTLMEFAVAGDPGDDLLQ
ncbi:LON peptidase substrate-binding domain-containing protein [Amylibacter sp. IMCC11727]|uniref:LON peptidase substrate-binding domain-containing protein n=1 Tax=Amylibacter sp. IMCC11727 TaxID=3039851 RepID=UPI00244DED8A|nr:LON peptidase substrate-binding domain-containing protein [Amylibacter sp. IMCC11727]WGI22214.1 LON peptidase substrate-binding domain-containing protein [Amylibacter sp. IMCC11727]